ncbi:MAG TPA: zf-HC2 domain-containing protein [Pyrinomonadaceae bacterium]|nr:zf-HC2 domain-containing protein [Pyrinomonadaceae bacterium]
MTRCLDEAKLQSYFDGELPLETMESVTSHLASCATCATAARELEEESALLMTALAAEFEASVPTERLRQRIDEAVLGERLVTARSSEKTSGFFAGLLNFGTQRTLGYASLAVVLSFAAIVGIVKMRSTPEENTASNAIQTPSQTPAKEQVAQAPPVNDTATPAPAEVSGPVNQIKVSYRPAKSTTNSAPKSTPAPVKLLPGERSYLQTIARLDSTIKSNKKGMRPALQVEYERNLAVVDRAIAATRSAAKSNPNDPDAADFMFAAYQSKVDFLNTIADARVGGGPRH